MSYQKIEKTAPYLVIVGSMLHIFCCGIPLLLSITNLSTMLGVSTLHMFELEWFERIEPYVLIISGFILVITIAGNYVFKSQNKSEIECDETCTQKRYFSEKLLYVAVFLLTLNILTVILNSSSH